VSKFLVEGRRGSCPREANSKSQGDCVGCEVFYEDAVHAVHVYSEVYVVNVLVSKPKREEGDDNRLDNHEGFDRIWRNGPLNGPAGRHLFAPGPSARRKRTPAGFVEIVS